jgi:hypothetical protein
MEDVHILKAKDWLALAFISFLAAGFAFLAGAAAPGLDLREKCELAGEPYSISPGSVKHLERQQIFPLHA